MRDANGILLAAATWKFNTLPDVDTAEALAVRLSLSFANDLGLFNLEAESDSLHVVQALKNNIHTPSYFGTVISNCNHLSLLFSNFGVLHVKRDANHLAHKLAKHALVSQESLNGLRISPIVLLLIFPEN